MPLRNPQSASRLGRNETGMQLTVNGDIHEAQAPLTVLGLIERFGLDPRKVAIERNFEIVPRSVYGETQLADGDRLEIVHFVGGG